MIHKKPYGILIYKWITNQLDLIIINKKKKKRTCKIVDFAVPADHRVKLKESEKKDKYLDLAKDWKNCGTWKWRLYQL